MAASPSISIAIVGSGGAGALTTGDTLLEAASAAGWYGLSTRTLGPQIRGGEAAALLRLAIHPVECLPDQFDLLIGIDWLNTHRFGAEIKVGPQTLVISDPRGGEPPPMVTQTGARIVEVPMKEMAKAIPEGRPNMIALGIASRLLGFSGEQVSAPIEKRLADKGLAAIQASLAGIRVGFGAAAGIDFEKQLAAPSPNSARRWLLSGNEATALGAIRGGIRFAAAYPITPATEILEWLAPSLPKVGGLLLQAEDELAAINMIIGSSFGGTPAMTATSGPGLSLMIEALGLATSAEIPVVVVDVMRGGPSTGIPTKSEQADLNIAVYGLHGDAPHLVLAPQSVGDCMFTTRWATYLAETLQAPVIVLSDQFMGQSRAAIQRPADVAFIGARTVATDTAGAYKRYAVAANGVSPMAIPGLRGGQYTADGLTHSERGTPTSGAATISPSRQAARQARTLQLRGPLGECRRCRRYRGYHLGIAYGRRARSGRTRGLGRESTPASSRRACWRRPGHNRWQPLLKASNTSWSSSKRIAASFTNTYGPTTTCRRRFTCSTGRGHCRSRPAKSIVRLRNGDSYVERRNAPSYQAADYKSDVLPICVLPAAAIITCSCRSRAHSLIGFATRTDRRRIRYRLLVAHSRLHELLWLSRRARPFARPSCWPESDAA